MNTDAKLLTSAAELEDIAREWWDLWRACPSATPFTSPAWLIPWWHAFSPGELRTIAVRCEGRLVGVAPLYLEDGELGSRLLPVGIGVSDFLDVLVDPMSDAADAIVAATLRLPGWSRWEMEEAEERALVLSLACPPGCREERCEQDHVLSVCLESVEGVRALQSPSLHRHLNLARNRAKGMGGLDIREVAGGDVPEFLRLMEELHRRAWETRGESGVLADPRVGAFHREAAPALHAAGLGRFFVAEADGKAVAALYLILRRGRHMGYLTAFDPDFAHCSPGALLLAHVIERALEEGATEFSFLRGDEAYKRAWRVVERRNIRRSFVRTSGDA